MEQSACYEVHHDCLEISHDDLVPSLHEAPKEANKTSRMTSMKSVQMTSIQKQTTMV